METSFADTIATVDAGRTSTVAGLRSLADRLEGLPLADVVELLVLLEPVLADLRRQAALAFERVPTGS